MNLKNSINQFYFDMTINELRLMNSIPIYPNITYNSIMYLDIISYKQNCTVSFIADALQISKSAVTIKVNELIKQGFVTKTQSLADKRINYLTVNETIIEEFKLYDHILHDTIQTIENKYSAEQIDTFCELLQQISKCYRNGVKNE